MPPMPCFYIIPYICLYNNILVHEFHQHFFTVAMGLKCRIFQMTPANNILEILYSKINQIVIDKAKSSYGKLGLPL